MKKVSPYYWVALLLAVCFTLGTLFVPRVENSKNWNGKHASANAFTMLLGSGRKLFANEFFVMADVYFHSGYYPSMFDQHEKTLDVAAPANGQTKDTDSTSDNFLGQPKDWIDALSRNFIPNRHTHLDSGGALGHAKSSSVQEILPWLKLAADMNPQMVKTYIVGAYWLRTSMHEPHEAEAFLREGWRHNPDSYKILYALGRLYFNSFHDSTRARNLLLLALKKWEKLDPKSKKENRINYEEIVVNLGNMERESGNYAQAIHWLEAGKKVSPHPSALQKQIDEIKAKMVASSSASTNSVH